MDIRQAIVEGIKDILGVIEFYLDFIDYQTIAVTLAVLIVFFALLFFIQLKRTRNTRKTNEMLDYLLMNVQPSRGIEKNLNSFLSFICPLITAHGYAFYLYDNKKNCFVLKAVKYLGDEDGLVGPSYSGLLPYKKESYVPPVSISMKEFPQKTSVLKEGGVPILEIPVKGEKAVIRLGPVAGVPKALKQTFDTFGEKLQPAVDVLIETEILKNKVEVVVASSNAMHSISNIILDELGILHAILGISIKTIGAAGGFFLKKVAGRISLELSIGMDKETEGLLREDIKSCEMMDGLLGEHAVVTIKKGERNYYSLPAYFAAVGIETLLLVKVDTGADESIAGFWYKTVLAMDGMDEFRLNALMILSKRLGEILMNHRKVKELSSSYVDTLQMLSQMMDNLSPYTIGYSEQMARYSTIIARQMNLSKEEIKEIYIAAYLSNIGVLGLSSDLFSKEGRFSELEYEMMKLHSDVGASIVETMLGDQKIASFIRYHHERIDGFGYPAGLKEAEIPLGSRILAVVQTFLAKINGRKGRSSLDFNKALALLQSAAGSQLDSQVVDILVGWFRNKAANITKPGSSLGLCWEMRCAPSNICKACPAYGQQEKNCWEFGGAHCTAHGNDCTNCFIRTEVLHRLDSKL